MILSVLPDCVRTGGRMNMWMREYFCVYSMNIVHACAQVMSLQSENNSVYIRVRDCMCMLVLHEYLSVCVRISGCIYVCV